MNWRVVRVVACISAFVSVLLTPSFAQNYYVVIGAFSTERDDVREFRSYLPGQQIDTFYTVNERNGVMHFYVLKTSSKEAAVEKSMRLQQALYPQPTISMGSKDAIVPEPAITATPIDEPAFGFATASSNSADLSNGNSSAPPAAKGKLFKFTVTAPDGNYLRSQVHHVDLNKGQELRAFESNNYVTVLKPGFDEPATVVCGVFGYREIEKYVDFNSPSKTEGAYMDENGAWVIPYSLERLKKGDVSVMYNVAFFQDAVAMKPQSKTDLDELVDMMKSNPNYVIKVHSHCNGKGSKNIYASGDPNSIFTTENSVIRKSNAKELTNLRAESVRGYLVSHGIEAERIKTYGWGATDMLVEPDSEHASMNDRIEIEILKD